MYGAKPVIRSSSPVRGGAFACCGYLVLDGLAGVCEVWIFPGESLWDGEGPQARRCAAKPPRGEPPPNPPGGGGATAPPQGRARVWPCVGAAGEARESRPEGGLACGPSLCPAAICPARKWIFITLLNGRGILAQQKAGGARRHIAGTGPIRDPDFWPANK